VDGREHIRHIPTTSSASAREPSLVKVNTSHTRRSVNGQQIRRSIGIEPAPDQQIQTPVTPPAVAVIPPSAAPGPGFRHPAELKNLQHV
jgi:hypothetical protein